MTTARELKALYQQGVNITEHLRREAAEDADAGEIIETAYDLQAGSYVQAVSDAERARYQAEKTAEIARLIRALCAPRTVMEAGVGEATTLSGVLRHLGGVRAYGFDLSWSRVAVARQWLEGQGFAGTRLCTGDLLHMPFADESIDVVYTSHSIEPNRGREEPILRELWRVAREALVLLEPGYELAGEEARRRMDANGYCRGLENTAVRLGYEVTEHRLFEFTRNPLNPTALTVIRKQPQGPAPAEAFACPRHKTPLREIGGMLYSPEALAVYPVLGGIPCLRIENAVLASLYAELMTCA